MAVTPTPACLSASGTSSKATAASSTPPPKAVMDAATRSGIVIRDATRAPTIRLAATASPNPAEEPRLLIAPPRVPRRRGHDLRRARRR